MHLNFSKTAGSCLITMWLPVLWQSCCGDLDSYFDITAIQVKNIENRLMTTTPVSGKPVQYYYPETDSIKTEYYGLLVETEVSYYTLGNLTTSAYACRPDEGGKGTKERIAAITITSNQDFDARHPAGSQLNDLIMIDAGYANHPMKLTEFLQSTPMPPNGGFKLTFTQKPASSLPHQFSVRYVHTDGEVFEETTQPVQLF